MTSVPQSEFYPNKETEVWVLFDLRITGTLERFHRERAAWQEDADVVMIGLDHAVLVVRPGGAQRLVE
jgi:hypothetical protein